MQTRPALLFLALAAAVHAENVAPSPQTTAPAVQQATSAAPLQALRASLHAIPDEPSASLERAEQYQQQGKHLLAAKTLLTLAEQDNAEAAIRLGGMLQSGEHIVQDLAAARALYLQAAQQGAAVAEALWGELDDPDTFDDHERIEAQAAAGDATAQRKLGEQYRKGSNIEQDMTKARDLLQQAAKQGEREAAFTLGVLAFNDNQLDSARDYFQQAAAWHALGRTEERREDYPAAIAAYEKGIAAGDDDSRTARAAHYLADGMAAQARSETDKAEENYRQAQALLAQAYGYRHDLLLAQTYREGLGVEKNTDEAIRLLQELADYPRPYYAQSVLYGYGADPAHREAMWQLSGLETQRGHAQEALQWAERAAGHGQPQAQYYLAQRYHINGEQPDAVASLYWREKAAENGYAPAAETLYLLYRDGREGYPQDAEKAQYYKALSTTASRYHLPADWFGILRGKPQHVGGGVL